MESGSGDMREPFGLVANSINAALEKRYISLLLDMELEFET